MSTLCEQLEKAFNGSITSRGKEQLMKIQIGVSALELYCMISGYPGHIECLDYIKSETGIIGAKEALDSVLIKFYIANPYENIPTIEWLKSLPSVEIKNETIFSEFKSKIPTPEELPPLAIYFCYFQMLEEIKKKNDVILYHLQKYTILLWFAAVNDSEEIYALYKKLTGDYLRMTRFALSR